MIRACLCLLWLVAFAVAVVVYLDTQQLGFPDGHLTDLERAQIPLRYVFLAANIGVGCVAFYTFWFGKKTVKSKTVLMAFVGYAVLCAIVLAINCGLSLRFDDGVGG